MRLRYVFSFGDFSFGLNVIAEQVYNLKQKSLYLFQSLILSFLWHMNLNIKFN